MKTALVTTILMALASTSFAGECVLKIKRDACPGKEAAAYKPYNGKVETEEKEAVADVAACKAKAVEAVKIRRKGTLSKKTVVATFDGAAAATETYSAECK